MTVGNSGDPIHHDEIVTNREQLGTFGYAQNIYSAWLHVKADESEMVVQAKGVDPNDGQVIDLYSISINRSMRMNTWLMLVAGIFVAIIVMSCCVMYCLNRR